MRIYSPDGKLLDTISTGGCRTTNLCFGGPDFDTLYVTVDDLGAMLTIPIGVKGYRLPFCPSTWEGEHPWAKMLPQPPAA